MPLKPACWAFAAVFILSWPLVNSFAEENSFQGQVNSDNINVRSDSTVSAEIICSVKRGQRLEVVQELYDWYKVRLPKSCHCYIKKNMVECAENTCASVKVIKERVNIRLKPDEASVIVGRADKDEILGVVKAKGEWYGIEPAQNSFGWIYKKFINKITVVDN